tara:strand:- start:705 stop:1169 length:465 start_codon:yes stop_codon:yes gene_type:complete
MKREDYEDYDKKLNLSEKQKEILLDKIDNDYLYFNANPDMEIEGFSAAFNNLYWLFLGELDTKDEFYDDEHDEVLRISVIDDLKFEDDKKEVINSFLEDLKSILSEEQLSELKNMLVSLYVRPKKFIENKFYFKNKYQLGKIKAELYLLKVLSK